MARYAIDAVTLLHIVDARLQIDPRHQLVAPSSIRSTALQLLLEDVRAGRRTEEGALDAHERMTGLKIRLLNNRVSGVLHRLAPGLFAAVPDDRAGAAWQPQLEDVALGAAGTGGHAAECALRGISAHEFMGQCRAL